MDCLDFLYRLHDLQKVNPSGFGDPLTEVEIHVSCVFCQIEVMHDFQGNRSCLYGSTTETDSEAEDNPEQVTRYTVFHLLHMIHDLKLDL